MNQHETTIENKYTLIERNKDLSIKVLSSDIVRLKSHKCCLSENYLNHWIDIGKSADNEDVISTKLSNNENTIRDYKASSKREDLNEFKDLMIPVFRAFLEFAYYLELDKQWYTPLNPLNLIYVEDDSHENGLIKAFYREPRVLGDIDSNFLNDVIKLSTYLFIPEEKDSIERYDQISGGQEYINDLQSSAEFYQLYGESGKDLIDFIINCLSPQIGSSFSSVKDIMDNICDDDSRIVSDPSNKGVVPDSLRTEPINMNEFIQGDSQEKEIPDETSDKPLTKKELKEKKRQEQRQRLLEQQKELEKKKAEKAKKKAERKKRQVPKKAKEVVQGQKTDKKQGSHKSKVPLVLFSAIVLGGGYLMIHHHVSTKSNSAEESSSIVSSVKSNDPMNNSTFKEGVEKSGSGDFTGAAKCFDKYFANGNSSEDMSNQEISTVFSAYLRTGQYQKILDNIGNQETATALVDYLTAQKQLSKVNDLNSSLPIIQFVKADNHHDYQGMINQANNVSLKKNKQLQDDLCNAYAQTNQLQQGKEWAETQSNSQDLINAIKAHAYQANKESQDQINQQLS